MIRFLLVRVLGPLILILLVRTVIVALTKLFTQSFTAPAAPEPKQASGSASGGELKKDPVCGTYVSAAAAVTKRARGEVVHFCSAECRDKYQAT